MTRRVYSWRVPAAPASDDTRTRLLAAARDVFAAKGLQRARMSDVAKAAEVSRQALYYHFHSKRELAGELVRVALGELGEQVRAGLADGPIDSIVPLLLHFYVRNTDLARLLLLQQVDVGLDLARLRDLGLGVLVEPLADRLAGDVDAGRVAPLDPRTAALAIVGAVNSCAVDLLFRDAAADVDVLVGELTCYVRRLIAAPSAAPARETDR